MKPTVAIIRGKFLNRYEMQFFEPLIEHFKLTGFGSKTCFHDAFSFPVKKLWSPMDIPDFPYRLPFLNRMFIDAQYLFGLENALKGFDLVHSAETYFGYTQQCLNAKKMGKVKKVIATVLENIPFNNEGIWGRKSFKKRAREELDHIIALTEKTRQALLAEGANSQKITVLGHFIDTKRFASGEALRDTKRISLLFVGRLEKEKGIFDVLSVMKSLVGERRLEKYTITLQIVGEGTRKKELETLTKAYGLTSFVTYKSQEYEDMPMVYRDADIYLAPSISTPTWDEQYNTTLLEAQAAGLPIVTTNTGGIPENVGDAGVCVPPGDIGLLKQAITAFIVSPALRQRYSKKARFRALHTHDMAIGATKLRKIYMHVLGEK